MKLNRVHYICLISLILPTLGFTPALHSQPPEPRVVTIYNFCRNSDYRVPNSTQVLLDTTAHQIELVHANHLHATWALQYDALMNPAYQSLFKQNLEPEDEIAAWWEIPRPLAEKAGIPWRGRHDWDSTANIGFSPGYTPEQRRKLVDVYMADFKSIFGHYPKTVGSWYIDEVTLAYMGDHYGIVASCNCKDQIGTDGYTLWGGYWNQAYYPSTLNAYMPAQTKAGQIDVPIFRMLGSDPIYQYGTPSGIYSLEPVYLQAGGSPQWVDWFLKNLIHEPSLAFAFTQAGQENSFGWDAMKQGLTYQLKALSQLAQAGEIRIETLQTAGEWFRSNFPVTPATCVVALDDWQNQNRKSIWYDSRFYRINFFWDKTGLSIRDLHRFDERVVSPTHDTALTERSLACATLPIIEGSLWAQGGKNADAVPILLKSDGQNEVLKPAGSPIVTELNNSDLRIIQPIAGGRSMQIVCREKGIAFVASDAQHKPLSFAWELRGNEKQAAAVAHVLPDRIGFDVSGTPYEVRIADGIGRFEQLPDGTIQLQSNSLGRLIVSIGD